MSKLLRLAPALGTGIYSYSECSRFLGVSTAQVRGRADGYVYRLNGEEKRREPVLQGDFACRELLDLARASYRMRDDDNIYLGRIEEQLQTSAREGLRRLALRGVSLLEIAKAF